MIPFPIHASGLLLHAVEAKIRPLIYVALNAEDRSWGEDLDAPGDPRKPW
jgi:hypothetical protein